MMGMKFFLASFLPLLLAAGPMPATQPSNITLHARDLPAPAMLIELAKQSGAVLPLSPPDLLEKNSISNLTLDLNHVSFWTAMELISQKTGLQPILNPEDPYPRFQLGMGNGSFWEEPHVINGPIILFANDVQRSNVVELGKKKAHQFERQLTVNLTAFVEPGLCVLAASDKVILKSAVDGNGRPFKAADAADATDPPSQENGGNGLYTWNLAVALHCPADTTGKIARLIGVTDLRIQTDGERLEIDDVMKARNVTRVVAGAPFTFRSLKKADDEYILGLHLRRDKKSERDWQDLYHSILNGRMALYDDKGRLVAGRATENGVDPTNNNKIDGTLRFVREAGITDPKAGEPFKLVWLAPTASKDLTVEFELRDLPIPP
jgi:hypothetical protein